MSPANNRGATDCCCPCDHPVRKLRDRYPLSPLSGYRVARLAYSSWYLTVFKGKIKAFGFGITDAADTPTFLRPDPFWRLAVEGATIEHPRLFKDEGEPVTWYTVVFDKPVSTAGLLMRTAAGDGFGIINATVAPIPLPAAGWLLLAGIGGLVAARKARKRV